MSHRLSSSALLVSLLCLLFGSGCDKQESFQELKQYVERIKSRPRGPIEPLPEVKPYEGYTYSAKTLRSPFVPPEPEEELYALPEDNGIRPDVERRKEPLESYPLDALRMVGTLEQQGKIWAVVLDTEGTVHRITDGNYLGQNHGKVQKITEEKVFVTEIIPDGRGGWQEREGSMALLEEE